MSEINPKQKEAIKSLMDELDNLATYIRGDWSMFDGRDLRKAMDIWLYKLGKITGIEYSPYYAPNHYTVQAERLKEAFSIDVSEWFKPDDYD